jgi:hypothetical protein
MDYVSCTALTKDSRVVVQERRSKFEVINKGRISINKVEVDGCLITDHREKCDWIISVDSLNLALFIELKGCDIDKAISQLKSTLNHTREKYGNYKRECFAVTTRIPKHGSSVRKKSLDFFKETKTTLTIKNLRSEVCV